MRRIADFRASWSTPTRSRAERARKSFRRRTWWVAGTVLTVGVLAAPGPALRFGPAPTFDRLLVGSRSAEHFVPIHNSGLAPLTIDEVRLSGDGARDFLIAPSDCTNQAVSAGASCVVGIFFAPGKEGPRIAALSVTSAGTAVASQLLLTGFAATRTDFRIEPSQIDFGDQAVGTASGEHLTQISGFAATAVRIHEARIVEEANGEFEVTRNTCTNGIANGQTCLVAVSFHPRLAGERTGQLELVTDTGTAPHEISLRGRGTSGDLLLEREQISFSATQVGQRSEPESVVVRNSGDTDVHLGEVVISGGSSADFILD